MYKLREIKRDDIPIINSWRNSQELVSNLGAPFRYINVDVDYSWFDSYMRSRNNTVRCAIIDDKDECVGLVTLANIDSLNQSAEFHIMIGDENERGKGAGSFATNEMLYHAFYNLNLQRIELGVLDNNNNAIQFYENFGFKREGRKRCAKFKNGMFIDLLIYSILRSEFTYKELTK